jgi:predicted transcriptional regulator of viral defense system
MSSSPDHDSLFNIAEAQAGYFTAKQARSVGFTPSLLAYHANIRQFERIEHGLYRLKRFPASPYEDLFAACLHVGPHAVVSHDSALALYELTDIMPAEIHLTVPRTASRRHAGLRLHTNKLEQSEITQFNGLRTTTVTRTILDVAASGLADELLIQAIQQSLRRGLTTLNNLQGVKGRGKKRVANLITKMMQKEETDI